MKKAFTLILTILILLTISSCKKDRFGSKTECFPLSEIRIIKGPFYEAQQTSKSYILSLDMDRLLAPFLKDAGIKPLQENYGNWENTGLDGHIGGHYLSALSLMYAATGEEEFLERLDYMLLWLDRCQVKNNDGYIGGIPGGKAIWKDISEGKIDAHAFSLNGKWVPLYNIHKLFAGLSDAYLYTGKEEALEMLGKLTDWMIEISGKLTDNQIQEMLKSEHGGLNDVFVSVYEYTGDHKYLELAERFSHKAILEPLLERTNKLTGLHANTQIPKVIGYMKYGMASGDESWKEASLYFWETVHDLWTVAIGGNSVREHFHPADDFSSMMHSEQGPETCNTYNMLKLTNLLFLDNPNSKYIDYYERAMYNHILSSQHPDKGGYVYMTSMRPQHYRVYSSPQESFWCCVGSGMENHAKYGQMIYAHTDHQLYINMFIPSTLSWKKAGVELLQETGFPYEKESRITLKLKKAKRLDIKLRKPDWIKEGSMEVRINGETQDVFADSTGYILLSKKWKDGDQLLINFQPRLIAEQLPDKSNWYSFLYGPIVLAAKTDTTNLVGLFADDSRMGHIASGPQYPLEEAPSIATDSDKDLISLLSPVDGKKLSFKLQSLKNTAEGYLQLQPFFELHDARYMIYWAVEE